VARPLSQRAGASSDGPGYGVRVADHDIRDNTDAGRFELLVDGRVAAFIDYRVRPAGYALVHAETERQFEGHGLASELVAGVFDRMRRSDRAVLPRCPFVVDYLRRHPADLDLVPADERDRLSARG
jgi:predicted GNAT family acetyltransferase